MRDDGNRPLRQRRIINVTSDYINGVSGSPRPTFRNGVPRNLNRCNVDKPTNVTLVRIPRTHNARLHLNCQRKIIFAVGQGRPPLHGAI